MNHSRLLLVGLLAVCGPSISQAQVRERPLADGDRVLIKLWMDSVFADMARVSSGTIILPRLGPLSIATVPASAVADSVQSAYARVFSPLAVEVTPLRKVTVVGEVRAPAIYFIELGSTLRDVIAMAGGIVEIGRTGYLTVLRDSVSTRVRNWQTRMDSSAVLQSGDFVIVEREPWVKRNAFTLVSGVSVLLSVILTLSR